MYLQLLNNVSITDNAPTLATDGFPVQKVASDQASGQGFNRSANSGVVAVKGTVTPSTTGSMVLRFFGYITVMDAWFPLGVGADADKGKLNNIQGTFTATGETGTDIIRHVELVQGFKHFDRLAIQRVTMSNISRLDAVLRSLGDEE